MIEVEYKSGIKEKRTFIRGDEMNNPRIREVLVFGDQGKSHTRKMMEAM